jgi:hypothetical protein
VTATGPRSWAGLKARDERPSTGVIARYSTCWLSAGIGDRGHRGRIALRNGLQTGGSVRQFIRRTFLSKPLLSKPWGRVDHSKLKGTVFGIHDWLDYLQDQAAEYRKLAEQADDPFVKTELLALASVCEEIADNIEDHLTGGEDHAPRGPLSRLS